MEYKDFLDLEEKDIWTTDANSCIFALQGQNAICTEKQANDADFFVPAETIPERMW